jgi:DNA-binding FrmR family transcriptional regulator
MAHLSKHNDDLLKRVKRIAGQVASIEKALTSGKDCSTTLHLVAAARGAMNGLMDEIIEAHMWDHVARGDLTATERKAGAEELMEAIRRYAK